jgi:hypothetical protein
MQIEDPDVGVYHFLKQFGHDILPLVYDLKTEVFYIVKNVWYRF